MNKHMPVALVTGVGPGTGAAFAPDVIPYLEKIEKAALTRH